MSTSTLPIYQPAIDRGLSVHPLKPHSKEPQLTDWPGKATNDLVIISEWAFRFPQANYGVAANDACCILESDNLDALRERLSKQLPETYMVQARANRPHIYFRQTQASRAAGNLDLPGIFEFKQRNPLSSR